MKIYKLYRKDQGDYDTYDSAVVVAENEESAKKINPNGLGKEVSNDFIDPWSQTWVLLDDVQVEYIGETEIDTSQVLVASFNTL